jgi:hypothetical protein
VWCPLWVMSGRAEVIDGHKKRPEAEPQVVYHQGLKIDYVAVVETTCCRLD